MTDSSLSEYERQLAEIEELLAASPGDASLLALQADILELMAAALQQQQPPQAATAEQQLLPEDDNEDKEPAEQQQHEVAQVEEPAALLGWDTVEKQTPATAVEAPPPDADAPMTTEAAAAATPTPPKRKKKSAKSSSTTFVVPKDLEPSEKDSKFDAKRKQKAVYRLRQAWESQQATAAATQKANSWQSFANKKSKKIKTGGASSMFQTDASAKVGVVGQRRMTKFEGPKKYK